MHTKVFVGNLSFKTKAEELAAEFSAAGRVVSANIITRGPRSLGYGFVEMENGEDAQKAVAMLNKKLVDSREINVELAKPREDKPPQERGDRRPRGSGRGGRGGRGGGGGGRGRGGPRAFGGHPAGGDNNNAPQNNNNNNNANNNNNNNSGANNNSNNNSNAPNSAGGAPARRSFRGGGRRFRRGGPAGGGDNAGHPQQQQQNQNAPSSSPSSSSSGGPPRRRRTFPRRDFANRTPSPTTLFVANLPFSLEDEGLTKLFKDQKVTKAHVVKNRNGRSKGFGFVEFDNEADQKAALDASSKLSAEGRDLIVKIALTAPEPKESSKDNNNNSNTNNNSAPASVPAAAAKEASSPKTEETKS